MICRIVNFVLSVGWENKHITWFIRINPIRIVHFTFTFYDNHNFLDVSVVVPVKCLTIRYFNWAFWVLAFNYCVVQIVNWSVGW